MPQLTKSQSAEYAGFPRDDGVLDDLRGHDVRDGVRKCYTRVDDVPYFYYITVSLKFYAKVSKKLQVCKHKSNLLMFTHLFTIGYNFFQSNHHTLNRICLPFLHPLHSA